MAYSVGLVSLGCAKNQVDGEIMLAALQKAGCRIESDASHADAVIINTCGFIDDAKSEAIDTILSFARLKSEGKIRAILVTGCLAERYREEVMKEMPEVDAVLGIGADSDIAAAVENALEGKKIQSFPEKNCLPLCGERRLLTPRWTAYLKIAEGCDNRCAYCAIPMIRGRYRSRTLESVEREARALAAGGAKELVLIAQDTTRYGLDRYGRLMLPELLRRLCRIEGLEWIRVLYGYPDTVTDELLETLASEKKIVRYMDLPLQHCNGEILRSMGRRGSRGELESLVAKMRRAVPGLVIRTTLIAGYPGETEEQFEELCGFVRKMRFERMGCFAYSQEEGTAAAALPDQLPEEEKRRRAEMVMEIQMNIMQEQGEQMAGKTLRVLAEGYDRDAGLWYGRSYMDSPDVDGRVYFQARGAQPVPGRFIRVNITGCDDGDLTGVAEEQGAAEDEPAE
jgi:ribosomal protein S12 methylthiotransferase